MTTQFKILLVVLIVLGIIGSIFYNAYNYGYEKSNQSCVQAKLEYEKELKAKLDRLEISLTQLAESNTTQAQVLAQDITKILVNTRKQPVTIIKDGKCTPSQTFVNNINQAINRANSK